MKFKSDSRNISKAWLFPIVVVIVVVPLILMLHGFYNGLSSYPWFGGNRMSFDLYMYYKSLAIKTCGAIVVVLVIGLYVRKDSSFILNKREYPVLLTIFLYSILTILSSAFAEVSWDATFGGYDRFEGCYVILSYVFFFYMVFGYARSKKMLQFIFDAIIIEAMLVGLAGVVESVGINIFELEWVKHLYFYLEPYDSLSAEVSTSSATGTLTNPNYVGSYVVLVLPCCLYILLKKNKIWRRVVAGIGALELGIFLYGSESDTGLVALVVEIIVTIVLLFPCFTTKRKVVFMFSGGALMLLVILALMMGDFNKYFFVEKKKNAIDNMVTSFNSIIISTSDNKKIRVTLDEKAISDDGWSKREKIDSVITLYDDNTEEKLNVYYKNKELILMENAYPELSFHFGSVYIPKEISVTGDAYNLDVFHIVDGVNDFKFGTFLGANICYLYNNYHSRVLLRNIERIGFDGNYGFANGRGYIWACTLPLLKENIFIGVGQDNFVYAFPNDDYVGKKYSGFDKNYVTKPHNLFLGIWVQQGLIALLLFLFLYMLLAIRVLRLCYCKRGKNEVRDAFCARGVAITSVIGASSFLVSGLANDSDVGVMPIYWIMLGIGYAAEAICRKKDETSDDAIKELPDLSEINGDDDITVEDTTFEEL